MKRMTKPSFTLHKAGRRGRAQRHDLPFVAGTAFGYEEGDLINMIAALTLQLKKLSRRVSTLENKMGVVVMNMDFDELPEEGDGIR